MGSRPRILAVDGDPLMLYLFVSVLGELDYTVLGTMRASRLAPLVRAIQPCLLIVDIGAGPQQAGWPALQQLRQDLALRELPVLVCTADSAFLLSHAVALRALGCHVLEKPFTLEQLIAWVLVLAGSA